MRDFLIDSPPLFIAESLIQRVVTPALFIARSCKCIIYLTKLWAAVVKVDLAKFDVKFLTKFLYIGLIKIRNSAETSSESF
jgi:hypothetical protein